MDVHQPEKPIRSLNEFLFHMFTVTLGILIALALEAAIEGHRTQTLVEHARGDFRTEYAANRAKILADIPLVTAQRDQLGTIIAFAEAKLAHRPAHEPPSSRGATVLTLQSTARQTATATQALVHMPFTEAERVTTAYSRQTNFNQLQDRAIQQWFDVSALSDADVDAPDVRASLRQVKVLHALLTTVIAFEHGLVGDYDRALAVLPKR